MNQTKSSSFFPPSQVKASGQPSSKKAKPQGTFDNQLSNDTTPGSQQFSFLSPHFNEINYGGINKNGIEPNINYLNKEAIINSLPQQPAPALGSNPLGSGVHGSLLFPNSSSRTSQQGHLRKSQAFQKFKDSKNSRLPDLATQHFINSKAFVFSPPKQGVLRKAKIVKNIFDLAKEDSFDPSPEASSIELFLLRQKQLGPNEVPPPGHYFDPDKYSSFKLKKSSSAYVHFDSTEQRILSFGNNPTNQSDLGGDDLQTPQEVHFQLKKKKYLSSLHQSKNKYIETDQRSSTASNHQVPILQSYSCLPITKSASLLGMVKRSNKASTSEKEFRTTSFGSSKRACSFAPITQFPGPGQYAENFDEKCNITKQASLKPNIYYKSFFGSGQKRFPEVKLMY